MRLLRVVDLVIGRAGTHGGYNYFHAGANDVKGIEVVERYLFGRRDAISTDS